MKKITKVIVAALLITMIMPFSFVNGASSKTQKILDKLNASELLKTVNGKAVYENDNISINYSTQDSYTTEISFPCSNNIIDYIPDEITNYDEASLETSHFLYAIKIIYEALKLNGYTSKEISDFFASSTYKPSFEVNGFEFKEMGQEKKFTSEDESSTITTTPTAIKIDVSRVNLNKSNEDVFEKTKTTIKKVADALNSDPEFTKYEDDEGKLYYENEVTVDDESVTIINTNYTYNYYDSNFYCASDVLEYTVEEIKDYDHAVEVSQHDLWILFFMQYALEENGYSQDEIKEFFSSEDSVLDFEKNGIEYKELGEAKSFKGKGGDVVTLAPLSVKIDFAKAKIIKKDYEVLDGKDQTFDKTKNTNLSFRFNIDYNKFKEQGKVYVDNELVESSNYTSEEGSTIITFKDEYVKELSNGTHTAKVEVINGQAVATFKIDETKLPDDYRPNPYTGKVNISTIMVSKAVNYLI